MPTYATPGFYVERIDTAAAAIPGVRTDVAAFVGVAEFGPVNTPTPVNSWQQFQSVFGNFIPQAFLAYAVKAFFENGGLRCWVVRAIADAVATKSDVAAVQPARRASSIVVDVSGFREGAVVTVRQDPNRQADYLIDSVDAAARRLTWDRPLDAQFELNVAGKPLHLETGGALASATLLDSAGQPTVLVSASSQGAWGNQVTVLAESTSASATQSSTVAQPPDRLSLYTDSITGFRSRAAVKVFQSKTPAPTVEYHSLASVDALNQRLLFDAALGAGFDLTAPISLESQEFSIGVFVNGVPKEVFSGLSLDRKHDRYVTTATAGSDWVRATDLDSPTPYPGRFPDITAPNLQRGLLFLRGGRDGIAGLRLEDLTGSASGLTRRGLRTFELTDEPAVVAIPDLMGQPVPAARFDTPPAPDPCPNGLPNNGPTVPIQPVFRERRYAFTEADLSRGQQALVNHCQANRRRLALLDPPFFLLSRDASDVQRWRMQFDSSYAALYFPWLFIFDPIRSRGDVTLAVPPSGHVAGTIAATDLATGVHAAPANRALAWVTGVRTEVNDALHGIFNPAGINCIRVLPGRGIRIYGARTISSDGQWRMLNVRRLLMMIEKSLELATQWAVFEPNNHQFSATIAAAVSAFLTELFHRGALVGTTPDQAFFVKCDNSQAGAGRFLCEIGVAPVHPAEFVVLRLGRSQDKLEITET